MACEDLKATYDALSAQLADLEAQIASDPKQEQAGEQAQLKALTAKVWAAGQAYGACHEATIVPLKVRGAQPQEILTIQHQNPAYGDGSSWGTTIAGGSFPGHQGFEWKQVTDTASEYDTTPVGATGWATFSDTASTDFKFTHPFGKDWEFLLALDNAYYSLCPLENTHLANGRDVISEFARLGLTNPAITGGEDVLGNVTSKGFLGVEWEIGLVNPSFQAEFSDGDRVAVFGRWIVDCGEDFHSEIHPPLLMASAGVYKKTPATADQNGLQYTRALFASRAYLAGQTFYEGTYSDKVYEDGVSDDGHFVQHMVNELRKAESWNIFDTSLKMEAHPKIKQNPFQGIHLFPFIIRTTEAKPAGDGRPLVVSFHFTVRSGCTVEVTRNDDSSVRVYIVINSAGYTPPKLPNRSAVNYSLDQINSDLNLVFKWELLAGLGALLNILRVPSSSPSVSLRFSD
jgi:hypothetical protein